jgi:nitroreductase
MDRSDAPVSELELAQGIAAAVRAVPGVADLSPGRFVEVATYGAREKVRGVSVRQTTETLDVEVHVCAQYAASLVLTELAALVRESIRQSVGASGAGMVSQTDVVFDDVRVEESLS